MQRRPSLADAQMTAKFLRAHAEYLRTGKTVYPFINSARAISDVSLDAAKMLEEQGYVSRDQHIEKLRLALHGIVGRWDDKNGIVEDEFIQRARDALSTYPGRRPWQPHTD